MRQSMLMAHSSWAARQQGLDLLELRRTTAQDENKKGTSRVVNRDAQETGWCEQMIHSWNQAPFAPLCEKKRTCTCILQPPLEVMIGRTGLVPGSAAAARRWCARMCPTRAAHSSTTGKGEEKRRERESHRQTLSDPQRGAVASN